MTERVAREPVTDPLEPFTGTTPLDRAWRAFLHDTQKWGGTGIPPEFAKHRPRIEAEASRAVLTAVLAEVRTLDGRDGGHRLSLMDRHALVVLIERRLALLDTLTETE